MAALDQQQAQAASVEQGSAPQEGAGTATSSPDGLSYAGPFPHVAASSSQPPPPTASERAYGHTNGSPHTKPAPKRDGATSDAAAVSGELTHALGLFRAQVAQEQTFHRQVKEARDKQGVVGAAEEDLEATEESIVHLWHSILKQKQKAFLSSHVVVPDLQIWNPIYAKLDQAASAAQRYAHSHAQSDLDEVRTCVHDAQAEYERCHQLVDEYTGRLKSGARALKVVGTCVVVIATIASGGLAAAAGAGLLGIAATTSVVTFGAEVGMGTLENKTGVTKVLGEDESFLHLVKQSGIDAATTFVSVLVAGGLSKLFMRGLSSVVAKGLGANTAKVMAQLGVESQADLAEHLVSPLQKYLLNAVTGGLSSPVTTAVQIVLSGASGKTTKTEFMHEVIDTAIQQGIIQLFVGAVTHGYQPRGKAGGWHGTETVEGESETGHTTHGSDSVTEHASVADGKLTASDEAKLHVLIKQGKITVAQAAKYEHGKLSGSEKGSITRQLHNGKLTGDEEVHLADGKLTAAEQAKLEVLIKQGKITASEAAKYEHGQLTGSEKGSITKQVHNVKLTANEEVTLDHGKISAHEEAKILVALKQGKITADEVARFQDGKLTAKETATFEKTIGNTTASGHEDVNFENGKLTASERAKIKILLDKGSITADEAADFKDGKLTARENASFEKKLANVAIDADEDVSVEAGKITAEEDAKVQILLKQGKITLEQAAKFAGGKLTADEHATFVKKLDSVTLTADQSASLKDGKLSLHEKAQLVKLLKTGKLTASEVASFQDGKLTVSQQAQFEAKFRGVQVTAGDLVDYEDGVLKADAFVQLVEQNAVTRTTEAIDAGVTVDDSGAKLHLDLKAGTRYMSGQGGIGGKLELTPGALDGFVGVRLGKLHLQVVVRAATVGGPPRFYLKEVDASVDGQPVLNHVLALLGKGGAAGFNLAGLKKIVLAEIGPIEHELKRLGIDLDDSSGKEDTATFAGAIAALTTQDKASLQEAGLLTAAGEFNSSLPLEAFVQKLMATSLDPEQRAAIIAALEGGSGPAAAP